MNKPGKEITQYARVMRLLGWLWSSFQIPSHLKVEFIPGDYSIGADTLYKRYQHKGRINEETRHGIQALECEGKEGKPSDEDLRQLHKEGHWKLDKMLWLCSQKKWKVEKERLR